MTVKKGSMTVKKGSMRVRTAAAWAQAPAPVQTVQTVRTVTMMRTLVKMKTVKAAAARAEAPAPAPVQTVKKMMMKRTSQKMNSRGPPPLQLQAEPRFPAPGANLGEGCAMCFLLRSTRPKCKINVSRQTAH